MKLYLKSGSLLAKNYNRVVFGERGEYVEFTLDQLSQPLKSKFYNNISIDKDLYYIWLLPTIGKEEKIYLQAKEVKYADYKVGLLYISPKDLKDFIYEGKQLNIF